MSLATIKQDMETKFVAEWSGTTLDKVRFENTQFTPPQKDYLVSLDTVFANSVNADASSATVNYHLAGVFSGTANDAATAQADHEGNIRVDSSGDIFIYVA